MMAWMNAETLQMTLDEGRMVYWSRSRQEVWRKGDTSGDGQYVREAFYDCDADVLLFLVEQDGNGRLPHRRVLVLLPPLRQRRLTSTAMRIRPDRAEFARQAAEHTMVPVWTELLADLETPVAAYAKLVGDGAGFLLESVEHGERWSRYSFVGRNPVATLELRDGQLRVDGVVPDDMPTDRGILAALDHLIATYRAPLHPDLPPLQGGVMGFLGYDVVREVEHLPDVPHDDRQLPDAVMSIIGSLAAFDHWRQRVYLIESVPTLRPRRRRSSTRPTTRRSPGSTRPSSTSASRCRTCPSPRRSPATSCPRCARRCPTGCTSKPSRWPRSTSSRATSSRSCWPSATTSSSTPTRSTSTGCCARSTPARTCTSTATRRSRSSVPRRSRWCRCSAAR